MEEIQAIYETIKDDFSEMAEDIERHTQHIKKKMHELIEHDCFEAADELKQQYLNIKALTGKLQELKSEYISLVEGSNLETETDYKRDLIDWTSITPKEVKLFGCGHKVESWKNILSLILEELIKRNSSYVDQLGELNEFKGRRVYFTYHEEEINKTLYNKASNGLFYLVGNSPNAMMSLCRKVLRLGGYEEEVLQITKYEGNTVQEALEVKAHTIKLGSCYGSLTMDREVFKAMIQSIIDRAQDYGKTYVQVREIENRFEDEIVKTTSYATAYPVVINLIKYLKDLNLIQHIPGTEKGQYIVENDEVLKQWLELNT